MPLIAAYCTAVRCALLSLAMLAVLAACGDDHDPSVVPYPIATDARRTFAPAPPAVMQGVQVGGLACSAVDGARLGVHLEVFIAGQVVLVPDGVGVGPGCTYPITTRDPTGVLLIRRDIRLTLADVFAEWGVALDTYRVGTFAGLVSAWVDGRPVNGDPGRVPLRRHAEIVVAIGEPAIIPHSGYRFAPGL